MEKALNGLFDKLVPPIGRHAIEGFAVGRMRLAEKYVDTVLRNVAKSFPPGITYDGYERCTHREEYLDHAKETSGKRSFNVARSSVYMVRYNFSLFGEPLSPRYVYLPFVEEPGLIWLSGSLYHMKPVLSHKVIAPMDNSVYVQLLCDKLNFFREFHQININGQDQTTTVVWSALYRKDSKTAKAAKVSIAKPTCMHYLLAKYGFTETFRRFCDFIPVIGTSKDITPAKYSYEDYVIVRSTRVKPEGYANQAYVESSDIVVAIPIHSWNAKVKAMMSGFFYVVDNFPQRLKVEYLDQTYTWMVLLGAINISSDYGDGRLYQRMEKHFISLDDYVDGIHKEKLAEQNVVINDFYGLLDAIIGNFDKWTSEAASKGNSVYGKHLDVLYSAMFGITRSIFLTSFQLIDMASDMRIGPEHRKQVERAFQLIKRGAIHRLTRDSPIVSNIDCSDENAYMRLTSQVELQEGPPTSRRQGARRKVANQRTHLHPSAIQFGSVLFLPKAQPQPQVRVNPYATVAPNGTVIESPATKEAIDRLCEIYRVRRV